MGKVLIRISTISNYLLQTIIIVGLINIYISPKIDRMKIAISFVAYFGLFLICKAGPGNSTEVSDGVFNQMTPGKLNPIILTSMN
jgi:hypothetical protein